MSAVRWASHGRDRSGVASTFIADRRKKGGKLNVYVKPNRHFRLPDDPQRPIIMIGAGTGVAPYRAFIEERAETGAKGKSWLFFGERNYTNDFLYQLEWQESPEERRADPHRRRLLARPAREDLRAAAAARAARTSCAAGSRTARTSTSAATRRAWRAMSTRCWRASSASASGDEAAGRARLKELAKAGRCTSERRLLMTDKRARNEIIKENSRQLRGTIAEGLDEVATGAIAEDDRSSPSSTAPTCRTTATCAASGRRRSWRRPSAS